MKALSPQQFELELRQYCDRVYERPSPPDNPMLKLMDGTLSRAEAHRFWGGHWDSVLIFNQITLPRLLERCPDVDGRVALWRAIYPEYGRGQLLKAHPALNRTFLVALGIPEAELSWELDRSRPGVKEKIEKLEGLDWLELLAHGFLGPETVGPKVFGMVANALASTFRIRKEDLMFFTVHFKEDQKDSEIIFSLLSRYATTAEQQQKVRRSLEAFFDLERYRHYCCDLGPMPYHFSRSPAGLPRSVDRRRHPRRPLELPARLEDGPSAVVCVTRDVSESGALLRTDQPRRIGSSLAVELTHPATGARTRLQARVVRMVHDEEGATVAVAVEFDAEEFLTRHLRGFFSEKP